MKKPIALMPLILLATILASGCSAMDKLKEENTLLKSRVGELEQVSNDYSDKLAATESLSAQEKSKMRREMETMRAEINQRLLEKDQRIEALAQQVKDLTVIEIGSQALFGSGLAELTPQGASTIRELVAVLENFPGYHIRVEGHTDSKPIGQNLKDQFASNWELSAARANSVVRYMIHGLGVDPTRISATGFAHYRPVAENTTESGRAANRRIRMVVFKQLQ